MKINPVSIATVNKSFAFKSIQKEQPKPLVTVTDDMPNNEIVQYGTWGSNYAFPITAGDIRRMEAEKAYAQNAKPSVDTRYDETPEEYLARKINSTEWML